jgi:leader peptidase (prepilin peptidase)/N-methyltransferase
MDALIWPILGGLLGLVAGSFLATLVVRWPDGRALSGRSCCDSCDVQLEARDLVPLLSWAMAVGKCRHCGAAIAAIHPGMELAAAAIGALALVANPSPDGLAGALFGWLLLALLALDLGHFWLPDRLTLPLLGLGLLFGAGSPAERLAGAAIGGGGALLLALAYRRLRGRDGLGMGDAKLMAGLGAWLSPAMIPALVLVSALIGLALAAVRARRGPGGSRATDPVPFGACLALSAFPLWLAGQAGTGG